MVPSGAMHPRGNTHRHRYRPRYNWGVVRGKGLDFVVAVVLFAAAEVFI